MHRRRECFAENFIPTFSHRVSMLSTIVSLFDALSMTNAMIRPVRPYISSVFQTTSAMFSPECSPTSSRKSISSSSVEDPENQYLSLTFDSTEPHQGVRHFLCNAQQWQGMHIDC
jgi:hypothetical protein